MIASGLLPAILVLFMAKGTSSLKSLKIRVPEVTASGETVTLSCDYDLEQEVLYTIKWYRYDVEFYRYVPKESPPFKSFKVEHINIDTSRSGPTRVTLLGVRPELTGDYKCEVSADAPYFHTDIKMAHMIVAELPNGNPVMNIEQTKVEVGKKIEAKCYSPGSNPPANITWSINGEEIVEEDESVKIHPTDIETNRELSLHSSTSKIEITTHRAHFLASSGRLSVKCEANIYNLWRKSVEDFVIDDTPLLAPVLGSTSSQSHVNNDDEVQESPAQVMSSSGLKLRVNELAVFLSMLFLAR